MTTIIQSYRTKDVPAWIQTCMGSVKQLAETNGWLYKFKGDEFFDLASNKVKRQCENNIYALSDVCRLLWIEKELKHSQQVIWLDADVMVFRPSAFNITMPNNYGFAHELLFLKDNALKYSLNNSVMMFEQKPRSIAALTLYLFRSKKILDNYPEGKVPRTAIGPMLLNNLPCKDTLNSVGLFTTAMMADFANQDFNKLTEYENLLGGQLSMANICHFMRNRMVGSQQELFDKMYYKAVNNLLMVV